MSIKVGIYGASGYAGQDLVELLRTRSDVEIVFGTSDSYAGEGIPGTGLSYIPHDDAPLEAVDAVFLALPHKASAPVARRALNAGVRVIDLSADLRLKTAEIYREWYGIDHPHPELLPTPYGLPELHRDQVTENTQAVAVPGCYPTATLLGLYPLLKHQALVPGTPFIVDAKSGVSGAGRTPKANTHFVEAYGNLSPYSPGRSHRHVGEIEQEIDALMPLAGPVIFTPHLVPIDRGLLASIYVTLNGGIGADEAQSLYEETYDSEPLVDVLPAGQQATMRHAQRKNNCAISLTPVNGTYLHITSVIDNLRKGASSQAIQNFNLMFGLDETTGLM
jgi:N-acetyl-gamma-glutamyl-phosphate reductase